MAAKKDETKTRVGNKLIYDRMGKDLSRLTKTLLTTWHSQRPGALSTQDGREARFYDHYRKVSEEYDKDFLKKYGEDLDTTLIFVGSTSSRDEHMLTR